MEPLSGKAGSQSLGLLSRWRKVATPFSVFDSWRARLSDRLQLVLLQDERQLRAWGGLGLGGTMRVETGCRQVGMGI